MSSCSEKVYKAYILSTFLTSYVDSGYQVIDSHVLVYQDVYSESLYFTVLNDTSCDISLKLTEKRPNSGPNLEVDHCNNLQGSVMPVAARQATVKDLEKC